MMRLRIFLIACLTGWLAVLSGCAEGTGTADPDRAAAEWVLRTGGRVGVFVLDELVEFTDAAELPVIPFQLHKVGWAGYPGDRFDHVDDAGVACLWQLDHLTQLDLTGTAITDASLPRIAALSGLRVLHLSDTAVTNDGVAALAALRELEELAVVGTQVTAAALKPLRDARPALRVYR